MLALDDLHDAAFGAAVGAAANDACEYAVAVHGVVHVVARDEQIAFDARDRLVGNNEAVAVAMRDHAAGDQIGIAAREALLGWRPLHSSCGWRGFGGLVGFGEFWRRSAAASNVWFP